MRYLIRASLMALSIATITPVAKAATLDGAPSANGTSIVQQDSTASWTNG